LVDCGQTQGHDRAIAIELWPVSPEEVDCLFLTHAHIDHIGRLPELIEAGFRGDIICSHPTKALLEPLLRDTLRLGGADRDKSRGLLRRIDELSWGFEYGKRFAVRHGVEFSFGRAGHILGSAFIQFFIPQGDGLKSVVFSGDVGRENTAILPDPDVPEPCDLLVLESTYGGRRHEGRGSRLEELGLALERALSDGGKVLIPAFALGRTQEILYELDRLWEDAEWGRRLRARGNEPLVPVFVDSPLGLKITSVYRELTPFYDAEAQELLAAGDDPIDFAHLYSTARYREHQELLGIPGPAIIIAGSGMCSGGRIVDHLRTGLSEARNDIIFVGYQAPGTPGHDIVKYGPKGGYVALDGERVEIRAQIRRLHGYSAHADEEELLSWVEKMEKPPARIKLVHGEPQAQQALGDSLRQRGYVIAP